MDNVNILYYSVSHNFRWIFKSKVGCKENAFDDALDAIYMSRIHKLYSATVIFM